MERFVYTTLGQFARLAEERTRRGGCAPTFDQLGRSILESGQYLLQPPRFTRAGPFFDPEAFRRHAYEAPVLVNLTVFERTAAETPRSALIPASREVLAGLELPFVTAALQRMDVCQVFYVYTGGCTLRLEAETRRYPAGSLILLAPHLLHALTADGDSLVESIYIQPDAFEQSFWHLLGNSDILSDFFRCALYGNGSTGYLTFSLDEPAPYLPLLQQIFDEAQLTNDEYANTIAVSALNILFARLIRDFGESVRLVDGGDGMQGSADFPAILRYVQYHYSTVSLPELAETFHFSEAYISRMFKRHLNQSFSATLQSMKLQRAKRYLMYSDCPVGEIAALVGYDAPEYLARIFRRSFGLTPSEFRRANAVSGAGA